MRRLLILALVLASPAFGAVTWTCVKDVQVVQEQYYEVVGTCTGAGTYTAAAGGDALGASNSMKDTAAALCHTSSQTLVDLLVSTSADGNAATNVVLAFDHTNLKLKCYGGAASGVVLAECATASAVPPFRFRAVCK